LVITILYLLQGKGVNMSRLEASCLQKCRIK
jgi:hypothetical protein